MHVCEFSQRRSDIQSIRIGDVQPLSTFQHSSLLATCLKLVGFVAFNSIEFHLFR